MLSKEDKLRVRDRYLDISRGRWQLDISTLGSSRRGIETS